MHRSSHIAFQLAIYDSERNSRVYNFYLGCDEGISNFILLVFYISMELI